MSDGIFPRNGNMDVFLAIARQKRDSSFAEARRIQRATEGMDPGPLRPTSLSYRPSFYFGRDFRDRPSAKLQEGRKPIDRDTSFFMGPEGLKVTEGIKGNLPGAYNLFARQGMDLTISHVPSGLQVAFPAFLELISDAYTCDWDEEGVFGRMDAIPSFRSTRRTLSVAWNVPAESFEHGVANLARVNKLLSFLYPLYDYSRTSDTDRQHGTGGATAINQSPLVRVSFGNLIQNAVDGRGLLGYMQGLTFDPVLEFGMFSRKIKASAGGAPVEYFPKTFRLNFELTVLHDHELGFKTQKDAQGKFQHLDKDVSFNNFPYASPSSAGLSQAPKQVYKITKSKVKAEDTPDNVLDTATEELDAIISDETEAVRVKTEAEIAAARRRAERNDINDAIGEASWGGP